MKNNWVLFTLLVFLSFVSLLLYQNNINEEELLYNFYSEQFAHQQVEKIIQNQEKWAWLGYVIIPLLVLIRSSLVAMCLSVGNFLYNINETTSPKFKQFFRIALIGEFVLLFVGLFKFGYFYFLRSDFTLIDLQQYYPLSFINFLDINTLEPWVVYPLQTINLFEVGYFFVLVHGLWKLLKNKFWRSFEIVAVSYGTGLIIWLGLVMFLTLNMT
ncbi:MAG: hypothetical protein PSN34_03030 [Urechidicola sp.]|nr:hypothetical protein [Urechidicola sp.]